MRGFFLRPAAVAAGALWLAVGPALAQAPVGKDPVASILTWTPQQQLERYPAIEKVYKVGTIKKGEKVRELPKAANQIDPQVTFGGRSYSLDKFMADNRISGLIAVKDGQIVVEKYALGRKPEDRWTTFSVAKSLTSILFGAALKDRYIRSIFDDVTYYLPELRGSAYDGVTLHQLISMTTGVKWNEDYANPKSDVAQAGQQPFRGGPQVDNNPLLNYMKGLKSEAKPGSKFVYKTGETDLAGLVLFRALGGKPLSQYASEKLWAPFGMEQDAVWMLDKSGIERGGCCMSATLRDYARIGLFMLGGGEIDGKSILADGYLERATTDRAPGDGLYGYFWWPRQDGAGYSAQGIFGQAIQIYPEENLVIVLNSAMPKASDRTQSQKINAITQAVRAAATAG